MLMQSPPMHAAGKSHSSMSAGDQRGGGVSGADPTQTARGCQGFPQSPGLRPHTRPIVGSGWGLDRGVPGLEPAQWKSWGREEWADCQLSGPLTLASAPVS